MTGSIRPYQSNFMLLGLDCIQNDNCLLKLQADFVRVAAAFVGINKTHLLKQSLKIKIING